MPRPSRNNEILALLPPAEALAWPRSKLGPLGQVKHLMKQTGMQTDGAVGRCLNQLHDAGLARVGRWNRAAKKPYAVWVQGGGEHAPKLVALPKKLARDRYVKNRAKAIERGLAGKPYDQRYSKHVLAAIATRTARNTRKMPVTWMTALHAGL